MLPFFTFFTIEGFSMVTNQSSLSDNNRLLWNDCKENFDKMMELSQPARGENSCYESDFWNLQETWFEILPSLRHRG